MDTPYQNPLAIRAKKLMAEAFFDLLRENPSEKIKITQLCKRAGVARRTFYTHFNGVEDIPRFFFTDHWVNIFKEHLINSLEKDLSPDQFFHFTMSHLFEYWGKQAECVSLLIEAGFREVIFDVILAGREAYFQVVGDSFGNFSGITNPIVSKYSISFEINTFIDLYCMWAETGMQQTAQEMAEIQLSFIIPDMLQKLSERFGDNP